MKNVPLPLQATQEEGWRAHLQLRFAARNERTYLAERRHVGPLLVQRPFHPEPNACHVYIVHPPGGVVGGDRLELNVEVGAGSHVLLTTPAATKFYRSGGSEALQLQSVHAEDAILEWLPQETIFHTGARVRSETVIELRRDARFIGWEIPCFGLPARDETFGSGELRLHLELWKDGRPLCVDRMRVLGNDESLRSAWGLGGHQAVGTLLAYPADNEALALARAVAEPGAELAATLVDGVLACRAVAQQAEPVKRAFIAIWQRLRPHLLGRPAVLPRIWKT